MERSVLFVCAGNSCRSPMAEAIFSATTAMRYQQDKTIKWYTDSASILKWNIGHLPEPRCLAVLSKHGFQTEHRGRLLTQADFHDFDFIFGMDYWNLETLMELAPSNSKAKIFLLGEFDPLKERQIRDPYFDDNSDGFEICFEHCLRCINSFLEHDVLSI